MVYFVRKRKIQPKNKFEITFFKNPFVEKGERQMQIQIMIDFEKTPYKLHIGTQKLSDRSKYTVR